MTTMSLQFLLTGNPSMVVRRSPSIHASLLGAQWQVEELIRDIGSFRYLLKTTLTRCTRRVQTPPKRCSVALWRVTIHRAMYKYVCTNPLSRPRLLQGDLVW